MSLAFYGFRSQVLILRSATRLAGHFQRITLRWVYMDQTQLARHLAFQSFRDQPINKHLVSFFNNCNLCLQDVCVRPTEVVNMIHVSQALCDSLAIRLQAFVNNCNGRSAAAGSIDLLASMSTKFWMMILPLFVMMLSGWNWTPCKLQTDDVSADGH